MSTSGECEASETATIEPDSTPPARYSPWVLAMISRWISEVPP